MRISEIISENNPHANFLIPSWVELGSDMSIADKISVFESYYADGKVLESEEHSVMYFNGLSKYSVVPQKNKQYIVVPLMLIQDRVMSLNTDLLQLTFLSNINGVMRFKKTNSDIVTFNEHFLGKQGIANVFIFDDLEKYTSFRAALIMKFDFNLPDLDPNTNFDKAHGRKKHDVDDE